MSFNSTASGVNSGGALAREQKAENPKIVDSGCGTLFIYDDAIVFSPPLYRQRYEMVKSKIKEVSNGTFTKVVDMGSAELGFFKYLREIPGIRDVVLVDKDGQKMQDNEYKIKPFTSDHLVLRSNPLTVRMVCGDVRFCDPVLLGAEVVTMIELIEHMQEWDLPALVNCVFHRIRPKLVIITTPNADFNKHIPKFTPGTFRHWDHKFEWTSKEFQIWCQSVIQSAGSYTVEYSGCGLGPNGDYCSQAAFFFRMTTDEEEALSLSMNNYLRLNNEDVNNLQPNTTYSNGGYILSPGVTEPGVFKMLAKYIYPHDRRTQSEKDRDHAIGQFHSLLRYLRAGGSPDSSYIECQDEAKELIGGGNQTSNLSSDFEFNKEDQVFFRVNHAEREEDISQKALEENEHVFTIVANKYAVISMVALSAWVNLGHDHTVETSIIRLAVEEECFEVEGEGTRWQGKVQLFEDLDSSSGETLENLEPQEEVEVEVEVEDEEDWDGGEWSRNPEELPSLGEGRANPTENWDWGPPDLDSGWES
ncbi:uncharacterized protein LOC122252554 isoform X2 [Penaeus japonicus]|uniref:uncharacterized protein LOC122252554 isoform X2 n=1 Tax=Penaeus japonicus TaxID=27405 RepID=UPI001C715CC1|nr:uncharacterized protein LOC122252554 isoform X2 [Penaeus japonicus]